MKRLSRSASSRIVRSELGAARFGRGRAAKSRSVPAEPMIEASGVRRSCEIEVSSAERRRSVSAARMRGLDVGDEVDPLDRDRGLVGQRVEAGGAARG